MKYIASIITSKEPYKSFAGSIEIVYDGFLITSENLSYQLPFSSAKISKGGFDGVHIIIEGNTNENIHLHITVQDNKILDELLLQGNVELIPIIRQLKNEVIKTAVWKKAALYTFIFFVFASIFAIYLGIEYLVNLALEKIPISLENELGQKIVQQLYKDNQMIRSGKVYDAIDKIFNKLLNADPETAKYKFQIHIVRDKTVNAFAAPGGQIVVLTGLLEKIESPEELAGILAHEIQHVLLRHSIKALLQKAGLYITLGIIFGSNADLLSVAANLGSKLATLSYSRKQEREADFNAVNLLIKANINPTKFVNFFKRLKNNTANLEKYLTILSTHPGLDEREAYLTELFHKINAYNGNYHKFDYQWIDIISNLKSNN